MSICLLFKLHAKKTGEIWTIQKEQFGMVGKIEKS